MRFFSLSCPVENEGASALEIMSYMEGSERYSLRQLSVNYSRTTIVQCYLICTFVREVVPITYTENGIILELTLRELKKGILSNFSTTFHNNMALDMNNAIKNSKMNIRDIIVLHSPVLRYNTKGKWSTLDIGVVDGQAIDVWQHSSNALNKTINPKSVAHCVNQQNITSLRNLKESTDEGSSEETILSYFVKPVKFWKIEGQVVKAICFFREIQPNGKAGCFFRMALHKKAAHQFHQVIEDRKVVFGDIIAFVKPDIFINPVFKSNFTLSGEPYFLEIGCKEKQIIIFCKQKTNLQIQTGDSQGKHTITCSPQTSLPDSQNNKKSYSSLNTTVSFTSESKVIDNTYLIPISLLKPSKQTLSIQNLSLVSGHCNQFCQKLFMYFEILWNAKKEPLCPKCYLILKLHLCLELKALLGTSGRLVTVLLAGNKAERFLEVSCNDFLDNSVKRKCALKVLESKYINGSEYKAFNMTVADATHVS